MPINDVHPDYQRLLDRQDSILDGLRSALDRLAGLYPSLAAAVARLLESDDSATNPFRLLPFPVLGTFSKAEHLALPVAMLSRIWWTGAEVFDDLADGDFDAAAVGISRAQAGIASAACMTLLPQAIIEQQVLPDQLRALWLREFAAGSLHAADGQLEDVSSGTKTATWAAVMRIYSGKTGAAYGRDAAMAAMLVGAAETEIRAWRAFGRLFGVLRQLANDRAAVPAEEDEDLSNGTRTLLLALAIQEADSHEAQVLETLRGRARHDLPARRLLREHLTGPGIASAYNRRVGAIHRKLSDLLAALAGTSEHRRLIQWMIDDSASVARVTNLAGAA